jgi:hypothetical protein
MQSEWSADHHEAQAFFGRLENLLNLHANVVDNKERPDSTQAIRQTMYHLYHHAIEGARGPDQSIHPHERKAENMFYHAVDILSEKRYEPMRVYKWMRQIENEHFPRGVSMRTIQFNMLTRNPVDEREQFLAYLNDAANDYIFTPKNKERKKRWAFLAQPVILFASAALDICPSMKRRRRIKDELINKQYQHELRHGIGRFETIRPL